MCTFVPILSPIGCFYLVTILLIGSLYENYNRFSPHPFDCLRGRCAGLIGRWVAVLRANFRSWIRDWPIKDREER